MLSQRAHGWERSLSDKESDMVCNVWTEMNILQWTVWYRVHTINCNACNELHQGAPWCRLDIKSGRLNGRLVRQNCSRCWCNWVSSTDHQRTKTPILEEAAFSGIIWFLYTSYSLVYQKKTELKPVAIRMPSDSAIVVSTLARWPPLADCSLSQLDITSRQPAVQLAATWFAGWTCRPRMTHSTIS